MNSRVPVTVLERPSTPTGNSQRPLTTQHTGGKLKYHLKLSSTAYVAQAPLANTSQAPLTHIHTYIHTYSGCNAQRTGGNLKYRLKLSSTAYVAQVPAATRKYLSSASYIHTYILRLQCSTYRRPPQAPLKTLKYHLRCSSTAYVAQVPDATLKCLSSATYIHTYLHTYIHTHIHTYIHAHIHTYVSQSWSTQHAIPQSSNSYRQLPSANSNSQAPHTTLKFNLLPKTQITSLEYWHQLKRLRQPRPQHLLALLAQEWLLEEINSPSAPHLKEINSSSAVFPSKQKHEKMKSHRHETFTAL